MYQSKRKRIFPNEAAALTVLLLVWACLPLTAQRDGEFLGLPPGEREEGVIGAVPPPDDFRHRPPPPPPPSLEGLSDEEREKIQEMMMVERLLDMPPERLAEVRKALERVEKMSPEEKERLRDKIRDFKKMKPKQQSDVIDRWRAIPPDHRMMLRRHMMSMTDEERHAEREKMKTMKPEERRQYFDNLFDRMRRNHEGPGMRERDNESADAEAAEAAAAAVGKDDKEEEK